MRFALVEIAKAEQEMRMHGPSAPFFEVRKASPRSAAVALFVTLVLLLLLPVSISAAGALPEQPAVSSGGGTMLELTPEQRREAIETETLQQLRFIRRIHVEKLGGGDTAAQIRDMIIAGLQNSGLFILTEDPERADAFLRGSAEDLVYTDQFAAGDGVNARAAINLPLGGGNTRSTNRTGASVGFGDSENVRRTERKHEASASLRLVNREGDVIWSTTQESTGAKFRGSGADVADKVTRKLAEALQKAHRRGSGMGVAPERAPETAGAGNDGNRE
jgi:hypothetical protein